MRFARRHAPRRRCGATCSDRTCAARSAAARFDAPTGASYPVVPFTGASPAPRCSPATTSARAGSTSRASSWRRRRRHRRGQQRADRAARRHLATGDRVQCGATTATTSTTAAGARAATSSSTASPTDDRRAQHHLRQLVAGARRGRRVPLQPGAEAATSGCGHQSQRLGPPQRLRGSATRHRRRLTSSTTPPTCASQRHHRRPRQIGLAVPAARRHRAPDVNLFRPTVPSGGLRSRAPPPDHDYNFFSITQIQFFHSHRPTNDVTNIDPMLAEPQTVVFDVDEIGVWQRTVTVHDGPFDLTARSPRRAAHDRQGIQRRQDGDDTSAPRRPRRTRWTVRAFFPSLAPLTAPAGRQQFSDTFSTTRPAQQQPCRRHRRAGGKMPIEDTVPINGHTTSARLRPAINARLTVTTRLDGESR